MSPCDRCYDRRLTVEALVTQLTACASRLPAWEEFVRTDPVAHGRALARASHARWIAEQLVDELESLRACCAAHWAPILADALQLRTAARIRDRCGMDLSLSLRTPVDRAAESLQAALDAAKAYDATPYT
ncbi:MAG: hypothetical protein OYL41_02860 [Acidobacteriota bacterium]|nr:hypothetical protein [Acidobacteriota bacterium]